MQGNANSHSEKLTIAYLAKSQFKKYQIDGINPTFSDILTCGPLLKVLYMRMVKQIQGNISCKQKLLQVRLKLKKSSKLMCDKLKKVTECQKSDINM